MSPNVLLEQGILLVIVLAGWFAGRGIFHFIRRRSPEADAGTGELTRLSDTISFVGGIAGILLGLLLVFAVQHFSDAQSASRDEAVKVTRLFYSLGPFDAAERGEVRQTLFCYMDSVVQDDWRASASGDTTGAENTTAWSKQFRSQLDELTVDTDKITTAFQVLDEQSLGVAEMRQYRLLISQPQIPLMVWIVIFLSSFVLAGLLGIHLADRRYLGRVSIVATYLVLAVVVAALGILDEPFRENSGGIEPTAMQGVIATLSDSYPETVPAGCPVLAASTFSTK